MRVVAQRRDGFIKARWGGEEAWDIEVLSPSTRVRTTLSISTKIPYLIFNLHSRWTKADESTWNDSTNHKSKHHSNIVSVHPQLLHPVFYLLITNSCTRWSPFAVEWLLFCPQVTVQPSDMLVGMFAHVFCKGVHIISHLMNNAKIISSVHVSIIFSLS